MERKAGVGGRWWGLVVAVKVDRAGKVFVTFFARDGTLALVPNSGPRVNRHHRWDGRIVDRPPLALERGP